MFAGGSVVPKILTLQFYICAYQLAVWLYEV